MSQNVEINLHHVTRVEGHGDISVVIKNGVLERVRFSVVEAPRFFEAFLRGLHFEQVAHIAPRICGLCSISHKSAALKAIEAAFGITLSEQSRIMRLLALHGEVLTSHLAHIFLLAGPDFFGQPSAFKLMQTQSDLVRLGFNLKKMAYAFCGALVGRHTHPLAMKVGGFSFLPEERSLNEMSDLMGCLREGLKSSVGAFRRITLPDFERQTEYVSLRNEERYAFYDGKIYSSDGQSISPTQYRRHLREWVEPHSTAKYASWNRPQYMVGALARFNNNHAQLAPLAQQAAHDLKVTPPCFNPYAGTLVQLVECIHCVEESSTLLAQLQEGGVDARDLAGPVQPRSGTGIGAVEAPRGLLLHEYSFDDTGRCLDANQVIPTGQNLGNIEADLHGVVSSLLEESEEIIRLRIEMLVRAYDPCISCSTHDLKVSFFRD